MTRQEVAMDEMPAIELVHTTRPFEAGPRCGAELGEPVVPWEHVADPDHPATFNCGACWLDLSGGREPMGGSRP
jgi:hypothetical protein